METGDTSSSTVMLNLIKQDGPLLQRGALALRDWVKQAEEESQKEVEDLTREINDLYQEQISQEREKQKLETRKSSLSKEKELYSQTRQDASRRKQQAELEKREAAKSYEELEKSWWSWIPIVGQSLTEHREREEEETSRAVAWYESDIKRAESEIARANSGILEVRMISQTESKCRITE